MKIIAGFKFTFLLSIICSCGQITSPENDSIPVSGKIALPGDTVDTMYHYTPYSQIVMEIKNKGKVISQKVFELQSDTSYYSNGKPQFVNVGNSPFDSKIFEYYSNGKLKRVSRQGVEFGCGMRVGKELNYDSLGNLVTEIIYDNYLPKDAGGCHETYTVISTTEYYSNKSIKLHKQEETAYEAGQECPCGMWEFYDKNGKLVRKEKFGSCNDAMMECSE
ncbi:MAG: hypothetical protein M3R17_16810 [Bacteroidota bacterium]|nr:hypothetical protein [Bacteroidota bacterium]